MTAAVAPKRKRGRPPKSLPIDGAGSPAPRGRRAPEFTVSPAERERIGLAHALWAIRAHLLGADPRTPTVEHFVGVLERACDTLCPPDGSRFRAPRRTPGARNGDGR